MDKVWLFDCPAKELNPDFTIVSVLYDEFTWKEATVGVRVQFVNRSHFDKNFTECLEKENRKMKTKSEPHKLTESPLASSGQSEEKPRGTETEDYYDYWEQDVRNLSHFSYCIAFPLRIVFLFAFTQRFSMVIMEK